jgi:medium-chain acyl-[acyl-carrier-protein] hydrolase
MSAPSTGAEPDLDRRWLKRFGRTRPAETRLLCFHHAGGSAAAYRPWAQTLPWYVEPVGVQLPGRADRFLETAYDRMEPLVDDLVQAVLPVLDRPFAVYGVSMGARVAWSLTRALRERSLPLPHTLFLACDPAPAHDDGTFRWEGRPDGLEGYLREMGGTPQEVLAAPQLLAALLPTLRADLDVLSTHRPRPQAPLDVPIHAFAGTDDAEAPPGRMRAWADETTAGFTLDLVPGGHFFPPEGERQVVRAIGHDLA